MVIIIIFFLILLSIATYYILNLNNVISTQKNQIMLLMRENNNLKNKLNDNPTMTDTVTIYYTAPKYPYGIVSSSCNLYLAPVHNHLIICRLKSNEKLKILDCAKVGHIIWYEVKLSSSNNINDKGWIEAKNIMIFENNIIKSPK